MGTYYLKQRDTLPTLEVVLLKPDLTPYDPSGGVVTMHVHISSGGTLSRTMTINNGPLGTVRYTWLAADWSAAAPAVVLLSGVHRMEFEVVGPGAARLTFPNDGYDALKVSSDIGQA